MRYCEGTPVSRLRDMHIVLQAELWSGAWVRPQSMLAPKGLFKGCLDPVSVLTGLQLYLVPCFCPVYDFRFWPGLSLTWSWILAILLLTHSWPQLCLQLGSCLCFCTSLPAYCWPRLLLWPGFCLWFGSMLLPSAFPGCHLHLLQQMLCVPGLKHVGSLLNLCCTWSSSLTLAGPSRKGSISDPMSCQTSWDCISSHQVLLSTSTRTRAPLVPWHYLFHSQRGLGWRYKRGQPRHFSLLSGARQKLSNIDYIHGLWFKKV